MALPTTVPVTEPNGRHGQYPLPPFFSERASPVYIDYRVEVVVKRGMFKVDQPLTLSFGYLPVAYPEAPSTLRRMAYNEGSLLFGPEGDPEGWKVCETVKEKGTLFSVTSEKSQKWLSWLFGYFFGLPAPLKPFRSYVPNLLLLSGAFLAPKGPKSPQKACQKVEVCVILLMQSGRSRVFGTSSAAFSDAIMKDAQVCCESKLAIATPLCYAIGTPIPIEITLRSSDKQALDLLTTPEALRVHLVRSMTTGSDAMDDDAPRRSNSHFLESVGDAYFWIQLELKLKGNLDGAPQEGGKGGRLLRGEIEVQKTSKPSFKFPRFTMRFMIQMLPLKASGFTPATSSDKTFVPEEPLIRVPVTVITRQAPGVKTRSYALPGYEKRQGGDYNKSMGFMENGNQRCFHHLR